MLESIKETEEETTAPPLTQEEDSEVETDLAPESFRVPKEGGDDARTDDAAARTLPWSSYTVLERQAIRVAERPCTYFWVAFIISVALSVIGMVAGNFTVAVVR
jgi:hypothetical protein